jgi:hypothetical protein
MTRLGTEAVPVPTIGIDTALPNGITVTLIVERTRLSAVASTVTCVVPGVFAEMLKPVAVCVPMLAIALSALRAVNPALARPLMLTTIGMSRLGVTVTFVGVTRIFGPGPDTGFTMICADADLVGSFFDVAVIVAIPGAIVFDNWIGQSRRRFATGLVALALPVFIAAQILRARSASVEQIMRDWPARVSSLPSGATIVTGRPCPAVPLVSAVLAHLEERSAPVPNWVTVCPGWAWPADLSARLDAALRGGRVVAVDLRPDVWVGDEQQQARTAVVRYLERSPAVAAIGAGRIVVWR